VDADLELNGDSRPWQVGQDAGRTAVDPIRRFAADRTARVAGGGTGADGQPLVLDEEYIDAQGRRE